MTANKDTNNNNTDVTAEQAGLNSLLSAEASVYPFAFVSSEEFYLGGAE